MDRAEEAVIRLCIRTSFNGFDRQPFMDGKDETADCRKDLKQAEAVSFVEAERRHREDYGALFDRVDLTLGTKGEEAEDGGEQCREELPTDERLRRFSPGDRRILGCANCSFIMEDIC